MNVDGEHPKATVGDLATYVQSLTPVRVEVGVSEA